MTTDSARAKFIIHISTTEQNHEMTKYQDLKCQAIRGLTKFQQLVSTVLMVLESDIQILSSNKTYIYLLKQNTNDLSHAPSKKIAEDTRVDIKIILNHLQETIMMSTYSNFQATDCEH